MNGDQGTRMERLMDMVSRIDERSKGTAEWRETVDAKLDGLASKKDVDAVTRRVSRLEKWVFGVATAVTGTIAAWFKGHTGL